MSIINIACMTYKEVMLRWAHNINALACVTFVVLVHMIVQVTILGHTMLPDTLQPKISIPV